MDDDDDDDVELGVSKFPTVSRRDGLLTTHLCQDMWLGTHRHFPDTDTFTHHSPFTQTDTDSHPFQRYPIHTSHSNSHYIPSAREASIQRHRRLREPLSCLAVTGRMQAAPQLRFFSRNGPENRP